MCDKITVAVSLFWNGPWHENYSACQIDLIAQSPRHAYEYAVMNLHCRWPEAESYIMKYPYYAYKYSYYVLKERWPEAEPYIMKDPKWAFCYARDVICGRWREAEKYIYKDSSNIYKYRQIWAHNE